MTAKGATSSLNKGWRALYSVTATSLLVAAAMLLLRFSAARAYRAVWICPKRPCLCVREAGARRCVYAQRQLASSNTLASQAALIHRRRERPHGHHLSSELSQNDQTEC